jgi:hypothetical protein
MGVCERFQKEIPREALARCLARANEKVAVG